MAGMRDTLNEFLKTDGVKTAVIVGRDGFVIEGVSSDGRVDIEAVAAVISTGLAHSELMGKELGVGAMEQGMLEYSDGVLVTGSLGEYALLCLVCDHGANLGMVRMQIRKRGPEIVEMI